MQRSLFSKDFLLNSDQNSIEQLKSPTSYQSPSQQTRVTASNYKTVSQKTGGDLNILKTRTFEPPVDEEDAFMQMKCQNQSRFTNANGYVNVRQPGSTIKRMIDERLIEQYASSGYAHDRTSGDLIHKYKGTKIYVYHSQSPSVASGGKAATPDMQIVGSNQPNHR